MSAVPLARALVAEAIGTFALVFGAGAVMVDARAYQFVRGEQSRPAGLGGQAAASTEEAA